MNTSDPDKSIPPPAYTEQEFDRKVATVLDASLGDGQDEWEEWDEAKFEAAAAALRTQSSTSSYGQSSRDVKKPPPPSSSYPPEKQGSSSGMSPHYPGSTDAARPNNQGPAYQERTSSSQLPSQSLGQTSHAGSMDSGPLQTYHHPPPSSSLPYGDEEDTSIPPPPFTGVGPSLDGPPYEEVMRLSYNPPSEEQLDIRLPSPSWSSHPEDIPPRPSSAATSIHPYPSEDHRVGRHEEGHAHPYRSAYSRQPTNKYAPRMQAPAPRMDFNPAVAYGRPMMNDSTAPRPSAQVVDPSAFYNSSVSSYLSVRSSQTLHPIPYQTKVIPSNTSVYNPHSSSDNFNRNSFTTSPAFPVPTYSAVSPAQNTLGASQVNRRPSYQHLGPGANEPRWAMSEQQFPF